MKKRAKKSKWLSNDMWWQVSDRKKPIAYSTTGCGNSLYVIWKQGYSTPNEMKEAIEKKLFIVGTEEMMVLDEFISLGYGDKKLMMKFY